jgi:mannose-6-phosphate isomerase-like protein (cupin superfamily)
MSRQTRTCASLFGIVCVVIVATLAGWSPVRAADPSPKLLKSGIVSFDDAPAHQADWGEMRRYFTGETAGTQDVLTAVAIVKPGKAVHRAHRHAQEEYLILVEGSGTWSLDGKEFPAKRSDILYTEPWVYHGLTNTSSEQLIFVVVRFNSKGVAIPPRPDDRPDEQ